MPGFPDVPGNHVVNVPLAVLDAATAGTLFDTPVFRAPVNGVVTAAYWTPQAAVTADGTNNCTLNIINKKADGSGTAKPATRSYAATNSVAYTTESMTLDATVANRQFAAGDVLAVSKTKAASGLALPAGVVTIHYQVR